MINIITNGIHCLAAVFVAIFTWLNYTMYKDIQKRDEEYKEQTKDLFRAIAISNLLSGSSGTSTTTINELIQIFDKKYDGKTKIFL